LTTIANHPAISPFDGIQKLPSINPFLIAGLVSTIVVFLSINFLTSYAWSGFLHFNKI